MRNVSVLITSYNHADTLRRAIDSVLMQMTTFPVQIVVIDDGSTDGSVEIIKDYFHRGVLSCVHCMEHYGIMKTYSVGFDRCTEKYIAVCDCDDYWIDPLKLQKQHDYMEDNPDCGICFTDVEYENKSNGFKQEAPQPPKEMSYDNMLKGGFIWSMTMMFRKSYYDKWASVKDLNRLKFFIWDYPIYLRLAYHSKIHYIPEKTACYVIHPESFSHTSKRSRRIKYVYGLAWIKLYHILKYGCSRNTLMYVLYRFIRDNYSIIFRRWNR